MTDVSIHASHWVYLVGIVAILLFMSFRRSVVLPSIVAVFLLGLVYKVFETGVDILSGLKAGIQVAYLATLNAAEELLGIVIVIAAMVAMLNSLKRLGSDIYILQPLKTIMQGTNSSFFVLAIVMYLGTTFFWGTPTISLFGVLLFPIAKSKGLPAIACAFVVNLAGNGMALSSDLVIQGAPALTAKAAGLSTSELLPVTFIFSTVIGVTAITIAFYRLKRDLKNGTLVTVSEESGDESISRHGDNLLVSTITRVSRPKAALLISVLVPCALLAVVMTLVLASAMGHPIEGEGATALLGGTALILLVAASLASDGWNATEQIGSRISEGLVFAIKIFAGVIPVAAFFFLGTPAHSQEVLGKGAPGFLFDLAAKGVPQSVGSVVIVTVAIVIVAIIAGLDGSGFSGLPLVGSLAAAVSVNTGADPIVLAALGQVVTIFVGGGTLTAWAFGLVADSGIAGADPYAVVRRNLAPVGIGVVFATGLALLIV